jgi:WD40 repeat protein
VEEREFAYDAFASHATDPDSAVVRDVERFLESLHDNPLIPPKYRVKLELCVDGSDFKTARRPQGEAGQGIREVLIGYMRQCRYFLLFTGPRSAAHEWVNFELAWWLLNRGADSVLLAVTHGEEEQGLFPASAVAAGLHQSIWVDLRGYKRTAAWRGRSYEEERLRLAGALLDAAPAELIAAWREEAARARRRQAIVRTYVVAALAMLLIVAGFALREWREKAQQARASEWALTSERIAAPQANRSLDRLAYALASFREHPTARSYTSLQQAMASLPIAAGSFRMPGGRAVQAIRFLDGDRLLLTISHDGIAQLTATATRMPAGRIPLSGRAYAVASHPGKPLLAVGTSGGLDLVEYSKTAARVIAHTNAGSPVRAVAFGPAGDVLYSGNFDGGVTEHRLRDGSWTAGRTLDVLDGIGARVGIIGFAPAWAKSRIEAIGIQGDRCILDLTAWKAACDRRPQAKVHALAAAPLSDVAAVAEVAGGVRVFRAVGADLARIPPPPADSKQITTGIALSDDAERAAVTAHDGTVRVYSVADQRLLNVVVGNGVARSAAFAASLNLLATGSDDGEVALWKTGNSTAEWSVSGVLAVAASAATARVAMLTRDSLQIRDARTGSLLGSTPVMNMPRSVSHFALTPDGSIAAARLERSDRVLVWSTDGSIHDPLILQHANAPGHVAVVSSIISGPGPTQLVTTESFQSRGASLWDAAQARLTARIPMEEEVFRGAAGKHTVAIADRSGVVRVLDTTTGKVHIAFRVGPMPSVLALDRDARALFIAWESRSCIYDLTAPLVCRSVRLDGPPGQALFSPSGRYLAIAFARDIRGGGVLIADREERWASRLLRSSSLVHHLAFSADERWIAAGHDQRGVSVFAMKDGEYVAEISAGAPLQRIALLSDASSILVTLGEDGSLRGWRWQPAHVVQAACSRWPASYVPMTLAGVAAIPSRDRLCQNEAFLSVDATQ